MRRARWTVAAAIWIVQSARAEIADSARKHDVDDEDLLRALRNPLRIIDQDDRDPSRVLVIGVDRAGRLLEVVVLRPDSAPPAIHGMLLRPSLYRLLDDRR